MKANQHIKSEAGFSLVQVVIGAGLLMIVIMGTLVITDGLRKTSMGTTAKTNQNKYIFAVVENFRQNIGSYQVTYSQEPIENLLEASKLPLAWENNRIFEVKDCPNCLGRIGYVIRPTFGGLGLFEVNLRISHKEINNNEPQDFVFFVGDVN